MIGQSRGILGNKSGARDQFFFTIVQRFKISELIIRLIGYGKIESPGWS